VEARHPVRRAAAPARPPRRALAVQQAIVDKTAQRPGCCPLSVGRTCQSLGDDGEQQLHALAVRQPDQRRNRPVRSGIRQELPGEPGRRPRRAASADPQLRVPVSGGQSRIRRNSTRGPTASGRVRSRNHHAVAHEIRAKYPFYNLDDIVAGSLNTQDEGAFDALAMMEWLHRKARGNGVDYIENEVVSMSTSGAHHRQCHAQDPRGDPRRHRRQRGRHACRAGGEDRRQVFPMTSVNTDAVATVPGPSDP
jgi:hypothetical protein